MLKKLCNLCREEKSIEQFSWKSKTNGIKQSYCKVCQNTRSRAHYQMFREKYISKAKKRNKKVLAEIQDYVWNYLSSHHCADCGEKNIIVLEFDHEKNKEYNLSELIRERSSISRIKTELEKCTVRCANCHRKKTAKDYGWKKAFFAPIA